MVAVLASCGGGDEADDSVTDQGAAPSTTTDIAETTCSEWSSLSESKRRDGAATLLQRLGKSGSIPASELADGISEACPAVPSKDIAEVGATVLVLLERGH